MTRIKQLKGFTLIELIVVVIIIGVLAAIAAVAYNQFVKNSRETAALANAKQVVTAVSAYGQQNDKTAFEVVDAAADVATLKTTLGVSGDLYIDLAAKGTAAAKGTIEVGSSSAHTCTLSLAGDLPVIDESTCE